MQTLKKSFERQNGIKDYILLKRTVTIDELCKKFRCSEATLRNDLTKLEKEGVLKRIRGGAIANEIVNHNSHLQKRMKENIKAKEKIAQYVVDYIIQAGMIITLDSGTTSIILAQKILDNQIPCTVITNNLSAATILSKNEDIQLCLAGGLFDHKHGCFHDETTDSIFKTYRSDIFFLSPNGIDSEGLVTSAGITEQSIKTKMIQHAKKTFVLADHSKFNKSELKILCTIKDVDTFITDDNVDKEIINTLSKKGAHFIII